MKRKLLLLVCSFICLLTAFTTCHAQQIYNQQNVTRDLVVDFYNDVKPVRVLEYSTDPAGNNIQRRLEVLPENGLPAKQVRLLDDNFESFPLIDTPPFDNIFNDHPSSGSYAVDAATILFGAQEFMKTIQNKFGWTGTDNNGIAGAPLIIYVRPLPSNTFNPMATCAYDRVAKDFGYYSNTKEADRLIGIDGFGHEIVHAIHDYKVGLTGYPDSDPCSEINSIEESLADIIALYVKNEYDQNSPAFYNWIFQKGQTVYPGRNFADPKLNEDPETYYGEFYTTLCPGDPYSYAPHQNANVVNHWYYLLANGTTGTETNDLGYSYKLNGIGVNKAIQIVWNCINLLSSKSNFNDLKDATRKAAEQLYGLHSTEYLAVMDAWCAVGICDNNLGPFYMSPAHGATGVEPWPGVNVNVTWEGLPVDEWEVQMATNAAFSENVQNVLIKNFNVVIKPGGGSAYSGLATGYYHPGERVYARARITKANANFCKGYNPLCVLYQQYGPAHAFTLDDKQTKFWHAVAGNSWTVNPWNDPTIEWKSVSNAQQYVLEVAEDEAFTKTVFTSNVAPSGNFQESGVINAMLESPKLYYTRVRAERFNTPSLTDNNGAWSQTEIIHVTTPRTSVLQGLNQKPGDPDIPVSSLGMWVGWYPFPGASHYVIQIAEDEAFTSIIRTQTAAGNLSTVEVVLPAVPDQTTLFVRVLPQLGASFGICDKSWRIKTDKNVARPEMNSPAAGTNFPFKNFLAVFKWKGGTLNLNLVDHFELHITEKTSGTTSIFTTQGKVFDQVVKDPLLFDDKQGFKATPQTSVVQALSQSQNDPPKQVSSLGFSVNWHAYPGASNYVIQAAKDGAFTDIVRSQTVLANINAIEFALPPLTNQTELFVRVLPQKGAAFGYCNNTWRVITDENAAIPTMKAPAKGTSFPFRNFVAVFQWANGTLNLNLVDHFEVWVTEKTFGLTSIFTTQGNVLDFALLDPFMFDDKMGLGVKIRAVGPLKSKSGYSETFDYNICPDHPEIIFPVDQISKVDALQDFSITWKDSFWFDPGSEYKVTIKDAGIPVPGFDHKPTTTTSMLVPAGTLTNGKKYSVTVQNSSSCQGIIFQANIFSTVSSGGSNQPEPAKLVNFNIELNGFRNDPDGTVFPPEYGTSNYLLGIELIDPDGNPLALVDPNGNLVTQLDVDSENSGVVMVAENKPQGMYKLRLKMQNIFDPLLYYPFDQPRFSVFLNGQPIVNPHVITANFADPDSPFNEWKNNFPFADIILHVK